MKDQVISYDAHGFILRGHRELLIGGEFHYFRTPHELWEDRLIKMARNGANLVTTYIPWNWHEPREGQERWSGDCDLDLFLRLCARHGLYVIIKPGPYCCAEWDFGGHPDWLLSKNIPLRVLNDAYLEYVRKWYRKVAEVIRPHLITQGGPIVCIQVENEYDHLMEYGEVKISREDAVRYFTRLADMLNEFGIDIPKFANEAAFLRGHPQIIDTRTYYPDIPLLQHWTHMHRYFDSKIRDAKKGQPNCPTMILELQTGWFAQFGRPLYLAPQHLTESVSKSVIALGASVLNYYMYVGGTTFPFWTCRGNTWDILPRGFGICTTFDFGGAPIREWGELMTGRMDYIRALSTFVKDFRDLVMMSEDSADIVVLHGGEDILRITANGAQPDSALQSESENFTVFARRLDDQYLVCIRNLGAEPKKMDIGFAHDGRPIFRSLTLHPRQTMLLPINVRVPGSNLSIAASTSELLFARKIGGRVWVGLFGKAGTEGYTEINGAPSVHMLDGDARVEGPRLTYTHLGVQLAEIGEDRLVILAQDLCGKVELLKKGLLVANTYFVREIEDLGERVRMLVQTRNGSTNRFSFFGDARSLAATAEGRAVKVTHTGSRFDFAFRVPKRKPLRIEWQEGWRICPDGIEVQPEFDDSDWTLLFQPVSLEEANLLDHGYTWYRAETDFPDDVIDAELAYWGNDCDRQHVYWNGQHLWEGITQEQNIGLKSALRPGRNVLAVLYENFFHSKSHPHEGAIRKYSGILKPLIVRGTTRGGARFERTISQFRVRQHLRQQLSGCLQFEFDDSHWRKLPPAHRYVFEADMGPVVWMRRRFMFQLAKGWEAGIRLTIPQAEQRCFLWVNGRALGQFESAGPQHDFYVPSPFLQKENVLVLCLEGHGAVLTEPEWGSFHEVRTIPVEIILG